MSALVTVATSHNPNRLTKKWFIEDGQPKKLNAGNMVTGTVGTREIDTPKQFARLLSELDSKQALIFGLPPAPACNVVTAKELPNAAPGTIARTAETFSWHAGPGWMLLDGDPIPGVDPLSRDEWLATLFEACPELSEAPAVWGVSSSSAIFNQDTGEQVTGIRGQRYYTKVIDARDIPRAGKVLFDRLWLLGHGRYVVSRSGSTLSRAPVDSSVWQTNRLDFAAPPVCVAPLAHRRPDPEAINDDAPALDTQAALPDLTAEERQRLADVMQAAREDDDIQLEIHQAREAWIEERLSTLPETLPEPEREEARGRLRDAVTNHRLFGDFELLHSSGQRVTVGVLLDDPEQWHGERFHDPLEPEYSNGDKRIAWANLRSGGAAYIWSHAHGGTKYRLLRPVQQMKMEQGELPQLLPRIMERIKLDGEIFERAGQLVRLADGALMSVDKAWLQTYLEGAFRFLGFDKSSSNWTPRDCPDKVAARILSARGAWDLPKAAGIVRFNVMRADGSIIEKPGFDERTGLILLSETEHAPHLRPLHSDELRATLRRIWEPFELFPFDSDVSRGVFFSALLTTVCRAALETAPGFLIRAYTPATGKTLLSECLMILAGAAPTALPLPESNPEEIEKRLFAKLLTGCPGLILDNLQGVIDNAALCAFLTSGEPEGRILGFSETRTVLNRALWLLNGNNVTAGGDTFRRILPVTLDANSETPETRRFTFNPRNLIKQDVHRYRADLLSVLLSFQAIGAPDSAPGSFGSFEAWERIVRQCLCWLIREGLTPAPMSDPLEVMALSKAEDPHHQQHAHILETWFEVFGDRVTHVRDIVRLVQGGDHQRSRPESELVEAVREIAPLKGEFNGRYFSGWMRRHKGRVVNGLRLDPGNQHQKEPGWRVSRPF